MKLIRVIKANNESNDIKIIANKLSNRLLKELEIVNVVLPYLSKYLKDNNLYEEEKWAINEYKETKNKIEEYLESIKNNSISKSKLLELDQFLREFKYICIDANSAKQELKFEIDFIKNTRNDKNKEYSLDSINSISQLNEFVKQKGFWGIYKPQQLINFLKRNINKFEDNSYEKSYEGSTKDEVRELIQNIKQDNSTKFYLIFEDFGENPGSYEKFRNIDDLKQFLIDNDY